MIDLMRILASETGLTEDDLIKIIRTAPRRYKVFEIPKRSGGMREIAQPARELKLLQRVLVKHLISNLPVHQAARAYRTGLSIRDNALPHAGGTPILKMDFENFFPSIRDTDWTDYCSNNHLLDKRDALLSAYLLFRRAKGEQLLKLSIGAPSSPSVSNALLFNFDTAVASEAERRGIQYTRYADDLTFSGQRTGMLKDMIKVVERTAKSIRQPALIVNKEKTTFVTSKRRRTVTGVTLANNGSLSLGHERKRRISAQVHHASLGKLTLEQTRLLSGYLAFAKVVEPDFLNRLTARYGEAVIQSIKASAKR